MMQPGRVGRRPLLAGGLLIAAGLLDVLSGYGSLTDDPYVVFSPRGLVHLDITGWSLLDVLIGAATAIAGLTTLTNRWWALTLAIAAATAGIAVHVLLFPYHPLLALMIAVLDGTAIRLLLSHRRGVRAAASEPPDGITRVGRSAR